MKSLTHPRDTWLSRLKCWLKTYLDLWKSRVQALDQVVQKSYIFLLEKEMNKQQKGKWAREKLTDIRCPIST